MKTVFSFVGIENHQNAAKECSFLFLMQRAALLGLKDAGCLNEMQHRQAEEMLLRQYREAGKND